MQLPKYFIHIRDHDLFAEDTEGIEVGSLDEVEHHVRKAVWAMTAEYLVPPDDEKRVVEITDERGDLVLSVPFTSVGQPN